MRRLRRSLVYPMAALALIAAACTDSADDPAPPADVTPTTVATTTAAPTTTEPAPPPVNRLVVIGGDGNVATMAPDGSDVVRLTEDSAPNIGYFQPSWSPDAGSVVVSRLSADGFGLVNFDLEAGTESVVTTDGNAFYVHWSPLSDRLGYLRSGPDGMGLAIAEFGETPTTTDVDVGQPFYFTWSPDGEKLATYVGQQRFEVRDAAPNSPGTEIAAPGAFQNPAWTEAGIFYIKRTGDVDQLVLGPPDGEARVLARSNGAAIFTVPAGGARVAIQSTGAVDGVSASFQEAPLLPLNRLVVVEVATGEVTRVTDTPALAYFWDPAGEQLLILEAKDNIQQLQWSVWADGELRELASFLPSRVFLQSYLPFFGQYALSTTMWAPDGSAIAFAGLIGDEGGVYVQAVSGGEPTKVADGSWVMWSPR